MRRMPDSSPLGRRGARKPRKDVKKVPEKRRRTPQNAFDNPRRTHEIVEPWTESEAQIGVTLRPLHGRVLIGEIKMLHKLCASGAKAFPHLKNLMVQCMIMTSGCCKEGQHTKADWPERLPDNNFVVSLLWLCLPRRNERS